MPGLSRAINVCPKCGWEEGNCVKYYPMGESRMDDSERLYCTCERCKYGWMVKPLDIPDVGEEKK